MKACLKSMGLFAVLVLACPCITQIDARVRCPDPAGPETNIIICVKIIEAHVAKELDADPEIFGVRLWTNEADCRVCVRINGEDAGCTPVKWGSDDPIWNREYCIEVPRGLTPIPIHVDCYDWDDDLGGASDHVDLDPTPGDRDLDLEFDPCSYLVTGDGIAEEDTVKGGNLNTYGGGDEFQEDGEIVMRIYVHNHMTSPPEWYNYGDLLLESADLVQVVEDASFAVANHPAVLRVVVSSSFDDVDGISVNTDIFGWIDDGVGHRTEQVVPIHLDHCETDTLYMFTDVPAIIGDASRVWYGAHIDRAKVYQLPSRPDCVDINDKSPDDQSMEVWRPRDLSIDFVRYCHPEDFDPIFDEAEATTNMIEAMERFDATYPAPIPIEHRLVPAVFENPAWSRFTGPGDEVAAMSAYYALFGHDRVVALVDSFWFEQQNYMWIDNDATGVSNGKLSPHFVIAETGMQNYWVSVHEIGHTFNLSAQPCDCVVELWNCWDEYEGDCFTGEPFRGVGYSIPWMSVVLGGTCFMDNEDASWIDNTCYRGLAEQLRGLEDPRVLVVSGFVTADGEGELTHALGIEEGFPDRPEPGMSSFKLSLRDVYHTAMGEYNIFPDWRDANEDSIPDGDENGDGIPDYFALPHRTAGRDTAYFSLRIPWPYAASELALVAPEVGGGLRTIGAMSLHDADVMELSEDPIGIELIEPLEDVVVAPGDSIIVRWRWPASIPAPHGVLIGLSYDGGEKFYPAMVPVLGDSAVLAMKGIEVPVTVKVRVLSLQNGLVGMDTSDDIATATPDQDDIRTPPIRLRLSQSPNPFHREASFTLGFPAEVRGSSFTLDVYDVAGRLVARVAEGKIASDTHSVSWGGADRRGRQLPAGVYFARLKVKGYTAERKLIKY